MSSRGTRFSRLEGSELGAGGKHVPMPGRMAGTGESVRNLARPGYLTFWRMFRAKALLRDGRYSLMQIAGRVGYDTDTALNRAFKRTQGVAPGEWRRREREALTA
jgi:AraC-like DNA-binding protein